MKKIIGVYFIKNKINQKFYVGHSVDIYTRYRHHKSYLKKGNHHSIYLQRAWDKYGEDNFELVIFKECDNEKESIELEQYFIDNYKGMLYNVSNNAYYGGDLLTGHPDRELIIEKRRRTQKIMMANMTDEEKRGKFGRSGSKNGMYGKHHTEEAKLIISKTHKGKPYAYKGQSLEERVGKERAVEIKQMLSNNMKLRTKELNPFFGKHHTEESKEKIKRANLGRKPTNMRSVEVEGVVYESVTEASRRLGVCPATIIYR